MYLKKKIIAIVPARIGSKRVKFKNLKTFKKKPIFLISMLSARKSQFIDEIFLSTDSKKINKIAKKNGFKTESLRQKKLSGSSSLTKDVVLDVLKKTRRKYDYFILLQPTSPLRSVKDIDASIKTIIKKKLNSLVSINESNKEINGAIYIQKINYFLKNKIFNHKNTYKFKMPSERSLDIDTPEDFKKLIKYENNR